MSLDPQSILLIFIALQVGLVIFRSRARQWHYHSDKPYHWNELRKRGQLDSRLQALEKAFDDKVRLYNFWLQIERLKREGVPGAFAELGVYKGETAAIIHALDSTRPFHLFDTFAGFSERDLGLESSPGKFYKPGMFADTSLVAVMQRLGPSPQLNFHPGYFPDTAAELNEPAFALVHLDADLYAPTLAACRYFYPLLSPGGVLIIHDYNHTWPGVRQAVDAFAAGIPESLIEIPDRQGSVMLIRNQSVQSF